MNNSNQIYRYNGSPVTFRKGDNVMVNATEMAKPFGKFPKDWLRTSQSKEFISTLSAVRHICPSELVKVVKGGNGEQGSWMHEDVALEFARWLAPAFAIWCNDRIKELLNTPHIETPEQIMARALVVAKATIERQKAAMDEAVKKAAQLDETNQGLKKQVDGLEQAKQMLLPGARFAKAVETSQHSILVGELARIIRQNGVEIGQNRLFEWLRGKGYLCKKGEMYNQPTQKALDMGLFEIKKTVITKPNGDSLITTTTKVTGKGQTYFVNKLLYEERKTESMFVNV